MVEALWVRVGIHGCTSGRLLEMGGPGVGMQGV